MVWCCNRAPGAWRHVTVGAGSRLASRHWLGTSIRRHYVLGRRSNAIFRISREGGPHAGSSGKSEVRKQSPSQAADRFTVDDQGRLLVNATPAELRALHKQHTSLHTQRIAEPYIGKWLKVSGRLHDVSKYSSTTFVTLEADSPLKIPDITLKLRFDDSVWGDRLALLHRGDHVSIIGKIEEISAVTITLTDCELA